MAAPANRLRAQLISTPYRAPVLHAATLAPQTGRRGRKRERWMRTRRWPWSSRSCAAQLNSDPPIPVTLLGDDSSVPRHSRDSPREFRRGVNEEAFPTTIAGSCEWRQGRSQPPFESLTGIGKPGTATADMPLVTTEGSHLT
ncbi:hypothetical protein ACP70R_027914 [Stipagrostis hirtigluma subsp. patula]